VGQVLALTIVVKLQSVELRLSEKSDKLKKNAKIESPSQFGIPAGN
jgi:hypothetical protein